MTPLTRLELDRGGCDTPNCGHDHSVLFLHSRCHPYAAVEACYEKGSGCVVLRCARCKQLVARIQVAKANDAATN